MQKNLTMENPQKVDHMKMVSEENFLRLTVTVCFPKKEYLKNIIFLAHLHKQVIKVRLSQIKVIFKPHSKNRGFTSLIILQV